MHSQPLRVRELCESRGGRPGLPVHNSPYGLCDREATLNSSCVKVEVVVLGSPSLIVRTVSVDVKQHWTQAEQELWESRGGCPGLPVPNSPYGLCGRGATLNSKNSNSIVACVPQLRTELCRTLVEKAARATVSPHPCILSVSATGCYPTLRQLYPNFADLNNEVCQDMKIATAETEGSLDTGRTRNTTAILP